MSVETGVSAEDGSELLVGGSLDAVVPDHKTGIRDYRGEPSG